MHFPNARGERAQGSFMPVVGFKQCLDGWDVVVGRGLHIEAWAGAGGKNFRFGTQSSMEK